MKSPISPARWRALWARLGARSEAEPLYQQLTRAYAEGHRAYHTLHHLGDCLEQFDRAREAVLYPNEVEAALWFHDAVYDPRSADNEEQSAHWAERSLREGGAAEVVACRVSALVLATRHNAVPADDDARLVVDVDLSILGREPGEFDEYERQIRREYEWVPEATYRQARAQILKTFLARAQIYQLVSFREKYEAQARENLKRSVDRLLG